jgi:hypothetical protein
MYQIANRLPAGQVEFTMSFHGSKTGGFYRDSAGQQPLTNQEIINEVNNSDIRPEQTIRSEVCWSGHRTNIEAMKIIARETNHPIIAADGAVVPHGTRNGTEPVTTTIRGDSDSSGRILIMPDGTVTPYVAPQ